MCSHLLACSTGTPRAAHDKRAPRLPSGATDCNYGGATELPLHRVPWGSARPLYLFLPTLLGGLGDVASSLHQARLLHDIYPERPITLIYACEHLTALRTLEASKLGDWLGLRYVGMEPAALHAALSEGLALAFAQTRQSQFRESSLISAFHGKGIRRLQYGEYTNDPGAAYLPTHHSQDLGIFYVFTGSGNQLHYGPPLALAPVNIPALINHYHSSPTPFREGDIFAFAYFHDTEAGQRYLDGLAMHHEKQPPPQRTHFVYVERSPSNLIDWRTEAHALQVPTELSETLLLTPLRTVAFDDFTRLVQASDYPPLLTGDLSFTLGMHHHGFVFYNGPVWKRRYIDDLIKNADADKIQAHETDVYGALRLHPERASREVKTRASAVARLLRKAGARAQATEAFAASFRPDAMRRSLERNIAFLEGTEESWFTSLSHEARRLLRGLMANPSISAEACHQSYTEKMLQQQARVELATRALTEHDRGRHWHQVEAALQPLLRGNKTPQASLDEANVKLSAIQEQRAVCDEFFRHLPETLR